MAQTTLQQILSILNDSKTGDELPLALSINPTDLFLIWSNANDRLESVQKSITDSFYILNTEKAAANGVATLDGNAKVPSDQLPSYVDDVLEGTYINSTTFNDPLGDPYSPETGIIYVDTTTNFEYRWSGSAYVQINNSTAIWGGISGDLQNQIDLVAEFLLKANLDGGNTLNGTQTLTSELQAQAGIDASLQEVKAGFARIYETNSNPGVIATIGAGLTTNGIVSLGFSGFIGESGANKSGFIHERVSSFGVGNFYMCVNNDADNSDITIADAAIRMTADKNLTIYGDLDATGNNITADSFTGSGVGLTGVNADTLDSLNSIDFARKTGASPQSIDPETTFNENISAIGDENLFGTEGQDNAILLQGSNSNKFRVENNNTTNIVSFTIETSGSYSFDKDVAVEGGLTIDQANPTITFKGTANTETITYSDADDAFQISQQLEVTGLVKSTSDISLSGGSGDFVSRDGSVGFTGTYDPSGGDQLQIKNGIIVGIV